MKDNKLNKLALKAGIFYIVGQLFIRGLTFLTTPVYTRLLTRAQYGEIRVYESWLLIMVPVMSLCLFRSVDRAKYDMGEKYNGYVSCVQTLSYFSIFGFFGICMLFRPQVQKLWGMTDVMFFMAFLYVFGYTSILFMQRREKQMMRYKASIFITTVTIVPATVLSIFLIYWGRVHGYLDKLVELRIWGFYVPQVIGGLIVAVLLWKQGGKFIQREYWKYALKYSLPLIPEMLSIQIMNQADKIMIQFLAGYDYTGIFALGTTISFIIWIVEDSVWNAFLPWMYEKISQGETADIENPWMILMHGFGILSWYLVVLAPEIVAVLGSKEYRMAVLLIAPMVTGTLLRFYSYIYTAIQNYYKKTAYVAVGTIFTMVINVILNYVCIIRFGYMAAAYTTAASYFILLVLQGYLEKKITGRRVVSLKKSVIISAVYLALNLATMELFVLQWYIRYGIILAVTVLAVKWILPQFLKVVKDFKK
ncbi:oligosaccharide flippase family protein [Lachnospiraceae bacterium MD308]|nr:oligosaccharide flippase family protein [Lachnospiraceae bacterium MD308]MCI8580159.1 oligosaccharide flippase family protein [Dorea sp.]